MDIFSNSSYKLFISFILLFFFSQFCYPKPTRALEEEQMQDEVCSGITINWELPSFSNTSTSERIYNLLGHFGGKHKLENMLQNQDTSKFVRDYIVVAIPQMIFFALTLIIIPVFLICLCKPCCKRPESKGLYKKSQLLYPTIIVFFFSVGVIVCGAFGFIYNKDFFNSFEKSECAFVGTFNHFYDGTTLHDKRWMGLTQINQIIENVMDSLDESQTTFQTTFSQTSWLENANSELETDLKQIYSTYGNLQIPSTDPQSSITYQPKSLQNMGPVESENTTLGKIYSEQNTLTGAMVDALQDLKEAVGDITTKYTTIKGNLQQGSNIISDFDKDFQSLNKDVNKVTKYTHKYQKEIHKGFLAFYIIAICIGGLVIVVSCIISFFNLIKFLFYSINNLKRYKLYYFLHISWCSYSLLMLVGFILSMGLMPLSVIMFSGCQVIDETMESQANYQMSKLFPSSVSLDVIQNTQICFFGDGDLNTAFETESSLKTLNLVTEGIETVKNSEVAEVPSGSNYLDQFIEILNNASQHVNEQVDDIPDQYLEVFNQFTNTQANTSQIVNCTKPSEDIWVYYSRDCPDTTTIWTKTDSPTLDFSNQICIVVNEFDPQVYKNQRAQLYTQAQYCQNEYEKISYENYDNLVEIVEAFQNSIYNYTVSMQGALLNASDSITDYQNHFQTYVTNLTDLKTSSLNTLESSVSTMLDEVSNSKTGLLTGLNCHFLNSSVTAFRNELCISFVPYSFAFAVIIFVASFCAFFAAIGAYLLAYRVTYNLKLKSQSQREFLLPEGNDYYQQVQNEQYNNQNVLETQ